MQLNLWYLWLFAIQHGLWAKQTYLSAMPPNIPIEHADFAHRTRRSSHRTGAPPTEPADWLRPVIGVRCEYAPQRKFFRFGVKMGYFHGLSIRKEENLQQNLEVVLMKKCTYTVISEPQSGKAITRGGGAWPQEQFQNLESRWAFSRPQ